MNDDEERALRDLDAVPRYALDDIFVLPEDLASDEMVLHWYDSMTNELRREAQGVPMKSGQYTLMERIAYAYAYMRYQERHNPDMSIRDRTELRKNWQEPLAEFNRLLEKHNDKLMTEMLVQVQGILKDELSIITNREERNALRRRLAERFANIDL
jgi:hypothetical protein